MAYKITTYVKEQTGGVFLIVSFKGKRFHISTGMKSLTKFAGSEFPATEPNHKAKTSRLRRFYCECEDYILQHPADSAERVKSALKAIVSGKEAAGGGGRPLHEYISEFGGTHNKSTADIYLTTAKRVRDFDAACNLGDVDKKWLEAYRAHELGRGRMLNGVGIDLRNIRATFNWAIDNGASVAYPFRKFSIKDERTQHLYLPAEQIRVLRDCPVEPYQEVYRDIFMLGFYLIGINISDLLELEKPDLRFGRIAYRRNKTHRLYDIKVEPEAQAIIDKYRGTKHLLRFLDDGCNVRGFTYNLNTALKRVGKLSVVKNKRGAYVKKSIEPLFPGITWYTARRSWATAAASLDIPKETIGKALGHSEWDNTTTDIYITFDNRKIDEANRRVLDLIK